MRWRAPAPCPGHLPELRIAGGQGEARPAPVESGDDGSFQPSRAIHSTYWAGATASSHLHGTAQQHGASQNLQRQPCRSKIFPVKPAHRPSRQVGSGRAPVRPETLDRSARRATLRGLETSTNVRIRTYVRIVSHRSPGPETHAAGFLKIWVAIAKSSRHSLCLARPPRTRHRCESMRLSWPQLCKPPFGAVAPHSACGWMGCRSSKLRRASVELPSLDDGAVSSRQDKQP